MKHLVSLAAGLALATSLSATAAAGDDAAEAAAAASRPVKAAAGAYESWFTGDDYGPDDILNQAPVLVDVANECSEAVARAVAAGAARDTAIKLASGEVTLGDAEEKVCHRLRVAAQNALDADRLADEARLDPSRKRSKVIACRCSCTTSRACTARVAS